MNLTNATRPCPRCGNTQPLSAPLTKTASIGIKDLLVVRVVKKIFDDVRGGNYHECVLTFKDGLKASCDLTGVEVADIFRNRAFHGKLQGMSPMENWFSRKFNYEPGQIPHDELGDNSWVESIHTETKENLQKAPSMSGNNEWVERVKKEEVEFKQKSKENKRADL